MESPLEQLVRPNIRKLTPYTSAREQFMDYGLTLLDANENALGPVGLSENPGHLHRYPDPYQRDLKKQLAKLKQHAPEGIVFGNGSDEIIDLLIRIFCEPGKDEILVTAPTYGMYKVAAHINNVGVNEVSLTQNFQLDADRVLKAVSAHTKVIFLCSPNNPSGNLLSKTQVELLLKGFQGILVIDEAYIDFAEQSSLIPWCRMYSTLVVMQTFSKAWGLAGIRLGVAYTSPEIAHYLNRVKPPYNVNQLTQQQAMQALNSASELNRSLQVIISERKLLAQSLAQLPMVEQIYPSQTNFLLIKMKKADEIFHYLINDGVIVRNRSRVHLCDGCLRITVGTADENRQLLDALSAFKL